MASLLIIRHPKTDEEYAVTAAVFRRVYEPQGFVALRHESGDEYEPPAKKGAKAAEDADEAKSEG